MKKLLSIAIAMAAAATAQAEQGNVGDWSINPSVGVQAFDSERNLDNEVFGALGVERRMGDNWGLELSVMDSSPNGDESYDPDVDLFQYHLDALYYLPETNSWAPYLAVGLGEGQFDGRHGADDHDETQLHAAFGLRYMLTEAWSLRGDFRVINSLDTEDTDKLFTLGLSYALGGGKPAAKDSDGDGVIDEHDRCPSTPAGVAVDAMGCALDSDNDGVPDYRDQCPNTEAGRKVDENGCKFVLKHTETIELSVNFATNSATVTEAYMAEIERVAKFMTKYAGVTAVIEGHTDSRGRDTYNKSLSQRRADAVKAVLVDRFQIAADRLEAVGYGEERPVASNDTPAGQMQNRRVVAVFKAEVTE